MKIRMLTRALALIVFIPAYAQAREIVVLSGGVGAAGILSGVDTQDPGTLTVGNQNINTTNDVGGGITTDAANTASIVFTGTSTVTGFTGTVGSTFLNIAAGANANTVTFNGQVFSTTFSVSGTGVVNFNGGFVSNSGSTLDFAGDGFINVAAGQTVSAAVTNTAGAHTGTLTLGANSILNGAVGAASGLKQITVTGGNAQITGQANAQAYTLGTNTLSVGGALTTPVAGVINTTIASQSVYGHIVPVGAATIGNALAVNVNVTGTIANNSIFNIVDAGSGTTGSTVIVTDNSLIYDFSADPTTAGLVQIRVSAVNPIIGVLPIVSPVLPILSGLPSGGALASATAQLNPGTANLYAPQESFRVTQRFQDLWSSHLEKIQNACAQSGAIILQDNKQRPPEDAAGCNPDDKHSNAWVVAFGALGQQDNHDGFEGYDSRMSGLMLGYDAPVNAQTRVGLGIRYARTTLDGNTFDTNSDIESYQATAYLGYTPGPWFANASLAYGLDNYSGSRHVVFPGVDDTVSTSYHGYQYTAYGVTGYHIYADNFRTVITPNASLQYTRLHANDYTETGDDAITLLVADQNYDFVQSSLGVKLAHDIALTGAKMLRPEVHANWLHSFNNDTMRNNATFNAGGSAFTDTGLKNSPEVGNLGAGLLFAGDKAWSLEGAYDYQWGSQGYQDNQATVKFVLHI